MNSSKVFEGGHSEPSCSGSGSGDGSRSVGMTEIIIKNNIKINVHIPIRKIHIHPIQPNMTDKIRAHFETYGEVERFNERKRGKLRFGFVQFKDAAAVETILLKECHRIGRRVINVRAAYSHQQPDYASIKSNPSIVPPEQDDAKHILKALNSDCFYEVFKLLDLPDLVNVAEVCTRFNHEAKETFSVSKYKDMVFTDTEFWSPNKMRKTMRHFGEYIRSLCIRSKSRAGDYLLRAMLDYCTDKLTELRLKHVSIREKSPELGPLFGKLEKLELMNCEFHTKLGRLLSDCAELKVLRLDTCILEYDDQSMGRALVNLREVHFIYGFINAKIIQQFTVSIPNVTKLTLNRGMFSSSDKVRLIYSIGQNMPNLQELEFIEYSEANFQEDVLAIGQLTQLRVLKLHFNCCEAAPLLNALCTNNVPIEHLKMTYVCIDDDAAECILKMNRIKVLELIDAYDLTNEDLIGWAKGLPEWQELRLASAADLTTTDLKKIVSYARKLKYMKLKGCGDITIDMDDYNVMLHAVQCRREKANLLIEIESDENVVNVPEETLNKHRHEFFIDEHVMDLDNDSNIIDNLLFGNGL